jgi:hypothetical protein
MITKTPNTHPLATAAEWRPVLDPARLTQTAEAAARALLREGESANTRMSYASAMRYWCAWYAARYGQALRLPVPVPCRDPVHRRSRGRGRSIRSRPRAQTKLGTLKPIRVQLRGVQMGLVSELPPEIDRALVANGYKGRLGVPALNTLVHRIAVLSKGVAHHLRRDAAGETRPRIAPFRLGHGRAASLRGGRSDPGEPAPRRCAFLVIGPMSTRSRTRKRTRPAPSARRT